MWEQTCIIKPDLFQLNEHFCIQIYLHCAIDPRQEAVDVGVHTRFVFSTTASPPAGEAHHMPATLSLTYQWTSTVPLEIIKMTPSEENVTILFVGEKEEIINVKMSDESSCLPDKNLCLHSDFQHRSCCWSLHLVHTLHECYTHYC